MSKKLTYKRIICALALLPALLLTAAEAQAARPEPGLARRGLTPAESALIDKSAYVDGSAYENPPPELKYVRIGLDYGEGAVSQAELRNPAGQGFYIGVYDENREFTELSRTGESRITVSFSTGGGGWHILIDGEYESLEKAEVSAAAYGGFAAEIDGSYRVLYGAYASRSEAERIRDRYRLPGAAYTEQSGSLRVLSAGSGESIYSAPEGESAIALLPVSGEEKGLTDYKGERYYGGFECAVFEGERLNVINCVELEDYVKGVIPYEMSYSWPYEALRAQAVCARTYVVYNQNEYAQYGFDLTDDTHSQVYRGTLEANETTDSAVDSTAGQLVRYRGEVCEIYYFASDGGATEDGINVFDADRPYLTGKIDPFEQAVDYTLSSWTAWRDGGELSRRLQGRGYEIGAVTALETELSDTGNVIAITFYDGEGNSLYVAGRDCYTSLGLNNCRFSVEQDGESFGFFGSGWGHNCGMSQWGANAMASVYGFDYQDIIRFYFTGAYIA